MVDTYDMTADQFKQFVNGLRQDVSDKVAMLLRRNVPQTTGHMVQSIHSVNKGALGSFVMGAEYVIYQDQGTMGRSQKPPWDAIAIWVEINFPFLDKYQQIMLTENIRVKIQREGTPPQRFIWKTIHQDLKKYVPALIKKNLDKYGVKSK